MKEWEMQALVSLSSCFSADVEMASSLDFRPFLQETLAGVLQSAISSQVALLADAFFGWLGDAEIAGQDIQQPCQSVGWQR